jgi:hypothetical protein
MMVGADDLRAGRDPSFDSVVGRVGGRVGPALVSTIAEFAVFLGLVLLPAIFAVVIVGPGAPATSALAPVLIAFFVVLLVVLAIAVRWALSQAAIVLDNFGPIGGLRRSQAVTKGNAWRLFGLFVVLGLLFLPLSVGLTVLALGPASPLLIAFIAFSGLISAPLTAIAMSTAYGDLTGRPAVAPVAGSTDRGRGILVAAILVVGAVALAIGAPNIGPALARVGTPFAPIEDRGKIFVGTLRNPFDACRPAGVQSTFSTSDPLYIGGSFTKFLFPGDTATVSIYIDGKLSKTTPMVNGTQTVRCWGEPEPVTLPPGAYRLVVSFGEETLAEGTFTVR